MKFVWTTINVGDMEASLGFYRDFLGLKLNRRSSPAEGIELAFLGEGETQVELFCRKGADIPDFGNSISLGFQVESLDAVIRELDFRGWPVVDGPFQPGPGIRFLFIRDPDGLRIQLAEMLDH